MALINTRHEASVTLTCVCGEEIFKEVKGHEDMSDRDFANQLAAKIERGGWKVLQPNTSNPKELMGWCPSCRQDTDFEE